MKALAALLLLVVAVTHYGYDLLAAGYADAQAAAKAWFYILRGAGGVVLFAVVLLQAWRRWGRAALIVALPCIWGMVEEGQTAACRLGRPIAEAPGHELFSGLCGSDWYWLGVVAAAVIGGMILDYRGRDHGLE